MPSLNDLEINKFKKKDDGTIVRGPYGDTVVSVDLNNVKTTSFDELKVASRFAQIELKSAVDQVSLLRNAVTQTNGSVDVNASGEFLVQTDAVLGANVFFESGERGRYIPGYQAEAGVGVRLPDQTWVGTQKVEWGYFDENDGIGYGVDAGGVYIFIERQGTVTAKVYQSNWNKDTLDGSGGIRNATGYTLDMSEGNVMQIEFIWYGYGPVQWFISIKDPNLRIGSSPVLIHSELPSQSTSISQPNLPIGVRINNGDQSTSKQIFVGGRQFSIYGEPVQRFRITGERRSNVSIAAGSWVPLISFRRKTGRGNTQSVEISSVNISANGNLFYSFVSAGTLTGASFGNLTDTATTETVVESDVSATAITGGHFFGGEYIYTGTNQSTSVGALRDLDFDFVNNDIVTLVVRTIGAQSVTVNAATFNIKEQW